MVLTRRGRTVNGHLKVSKQSQNSLRGGRGGRSLGSGSSSRNSSRACTHDVEAPLNTVNSSGGLISDGGEGGGSKVDVAHGASGASVDDLHNDGQAIGGVGNGRGHGNVALGATGTVGKAITTDPK